MWWQLCFRLQRQGHHAHSRLQPAAYCFIRSAATLAATQVAFQLTPAVMMEPPQTAVWQYGVALLLAGLLVGSCGQLSLVANISKLPKETLEWFANPDNLNSNMLPPGLDTWDPQPYIMSAVPIAASNVAINFSHELGHRLAAAVRNVKLGPTYFIPNLQLGSFGAITPITSLLKNRWVPAHVHACRHAHTSLDDAGVGYSWSSSIRARL